jgi:hypothetical protein
MNTQRSCRHGFFTHESYQPTMGLGVSIEYKSQTNQDRHIDELMDTQKANDHTKRFLTVHRSIVTGG